MANKEANLLLLIKTKGEEALDSIKDKFGAIGTVALAALGSISAAIIKGVSEYKEAEAAQNALTRTLVNNGMYSKALADSYNEQANALAKVTLFGDEQIVQAQNSFNQQARGVALTEQSTKAILDFAQAQGIDAARAAELVGKSVGTSTNALARYGIEVNESSSKSEKMAQVLEGLNSKFGGQAEAATSGLGALDQLSKAVGETFEALGEKVAPTITVVAQSLASLVNEGPGVSGFIDAIADGFNFIVKLGTSVAFAFQSLGTTIGGTFGTIAGSLQLLISGQFSAAKTALIDGFAEIATEREAIQTAHNQKMAELDQASFDSKIMNAEREKELLITTLQNKAIVEDEDRLSRRELKLQQMIEDENLKSQQEIALLGQRQSAVYAAEVAAADRRYQLATTQKAKTAALEEKFKATEMEREAKFNETRMQLLQGTLSSIASMQNSSNHHLAAMGKAAALTQLAIDGPMAIGRALASAPPPFNFALAAGVAAAMASQVANIAGVPLAEGGIVLPRPGGTQATIGEAGQAEAVIPLDRMRDFGLGGGGGTNVTIVVNGGMLGSETEAREFALAVDKELLKLRRNNESSAFDTGVI